MTVNSILRKAARKEPAVRLQLKKLQQPTQKAPDPTRPAAPLRPPVLTVAPTYLIRTVLRDAREVCLQLGGHLLEYVKPPAGEERVRGE